MIFCRLQSKQVWYKTGLAQLGIYVPAGLLLHDVLSFKKTILDTKCLVQTRENCIASFPLCTLYSDKWRLRIRGLVFFYSL